MSNLELKSIDNKPNKESTKDLHDFEVLEIPQELKDLQELTNISDQHVQKLIKTYKNELTTSPLLLWLEAYYGEIKDTKSLEKLIDKVSERKLTNAEMVDYIVEDCLNVRTTRENLANLNTNIDYDAKQSELYDKIQALKSKNFDKITLDNDSRNKALESISDPAEKLVLSYISTKDIPLPEIETTAKNSSAAQDPRFKDLSTRELIEHTDKVPWSIVKDLKLTPEKAKAIKELNYKTFIQIVRTNPEIINQDLIIDAIKHEKSTDKLQDKLIQKGALVPNARTKYGSKMAKAVVNYSIDQVFGNSVFKKSAAAKEVTTELDVANLLAHYITSWKVEKIPKSIIDKNQGYTDSRVALKSKTESSNQEEAKKQNEAEIEQTRIDLLHITDQKEESENKELAEIIKVIQSITWGFDIEEIKSEKRKYGENSTLCSRTACLNIEKLIDVAAEDDIDTQDVPLKWDAKVLIPSLLKSKAAEKIHLNSFSDPKDVKQLENLLKQRALESKGNVFDMYMYTKGKHRTTVFLGSDGNFYALDPYYGGNKTQKPVPLKDLLDNMADKVMKNDIVINKTVYAQISQESQKKLQEVYKKIETNYSLQTKLEEYYGDEDIVYKLSQYDEIAPYQDENITELPSTNIDAPKQPEAIQEDFTLAMLQLHVPKIYGDITYDELYTAITSISDPSLKTKCIQTIKAEKIMDFQLLLWMLKNAPLENKADGKIGQYTLNKIKEKINNNASIAEHNQQN